MLGRCFFKGLPTSPGGGRSEGPPDADWPGAVVDSCVDGFVGVSVGMLLSGSAECALLS
jgi:hypothetical protein